MTKNLDKLEDRIRDFFSAWYNGAVCMCCFIKDEWRITEKLFFEHWKMKKGYFFAHARDDINILQIWKALNSMELLLLTIRSIRWLLPSEPWAVCELTYTNHLRPGVFFLRPSQGRAQFPPALSAASCTLTFSTDTCSETRHQYFCCGGW